LLGQVFILVAVWIADASQQCIVICLLHDRGRVISFLKWKWKMSA